VYNAWLAGVVFETTYTLVHLRNVLSMQYMHSIVQYVCKYLFFIGYVLSQGRTHIRIYTFPQANVHIHTLTKLRMYAHKREFIHVYFF